MPRCEPCNRSFREKSSLKQHFRDSPPGSHASTTCERCNQVFGSEQSLQQHLSQSSAHLYDSSATTSQESDSDDRDIRSRMYPELHKDVLKATRQIKPSPKFESDLDLSYKQKHQTHVMAKFKCNNHGGFSTAWTSKKVAIVIHGYTSNRYNAVVYNQRCKKCNGLGEIYLNETSYVERVAYRLRKWAGFKEERPDFNKRKGPPHREDLCEGCQAGECQLTI